MSCIFINSDTLVLSSVDFSEARDSVRYLGHPAGISIAALSVAANAAYKGSSAGISSMQSIAAVHTAVFIANRRPTGRDLCRAHSERIHAELERLAALRDSQPRRSGMSPAFAAPCGLTEQDRGRLATAQAKRDRRAAKKGSK